MDKKPRITFHIGMHHTNSQLLTRFAKTNGKRLQENDVYVPPARRARKTLTAMLTQLDGLPPIASEEQHLLGELLDKSTSSHLFLNDEGRAGAMRDLFSGDVFYEGIETRLAPVAELFSTSDLRFSLTLVNPAILLHRALESGDAPHKLRSFVEATDPTLIRWRPVIQRLRDVFPEIPLTIWCDEDTPLVWYRLLKTLFNLPTPTDMNSLLLPIEPLLKEEGVARLKAYLVNFPPKTERQYARLALLFLEKYGTEEALAPRCDIPGWDDDVIERVSDNYEDDIALLAQDEGITFLLPEIPTE